MAIKVTTFVHATCVALQVGKSWRGVLLRGPSGAGKSDLALRLVEGGARLVADDQTALIQQQGQSLVGTPPGPIEGLLEVRGVGIVKLRRPQLLVRVPVALLVDLVPSDRIERLPDPARENLLGVDLPVLALAPFEASAPAKLRLALAQIATA